jgi:hypothetical protein
VIAYIPRQLGPKTEVAESSTLDIVFSGEIIHDAATGAVTISDAAFTSVGSDLAFVILIEDGEDETYKNSTALTEDE